MSQAGPVRSILQTRTIEELNVIRRELCPKVAPYDGDKSNYITRIRRSLTNRDVPCGELVSVIETLEANRRVTTRIRHRIQDVEFSYNASHGNQTGITENPLSSELFQGLRYKFDSDSEYTVYDEFRFGRYRPDLCVYGPPDRYYLIEVKIHGSMGSLLNKLSNYSNDIDYEKLFVCYITDSESRLPENSRSVSNALHDAAEKYNAEIIVKGPDAFRDGHGREDTSSLALPTAPSN